MPEDVELPYSCTAACEYANQYNDNWIECYHKRVCGGHVQVGKQCVARLWIELEKSVIIEKGGGEKR